VSNEGVPTKLPTDLSGNLILPPGWKWDDETNTAKAKRRIESGSAEKLWEDGYDSEVVLTESQQRIRDAYGFRRVAWYGDNGLWAGALVAAVFTIPWLWYFALDRLRELSAAVQGRSG
jgi:hypothetical protein